MSFKGLDFIRQRAKEHIYKARFLGEPQKSGLTWPRHSEKTQGRRRSNLKVLRRKSAPGEGHREGDGRPSA
jgi:hypothetical protein